MEAKEAIGKTFYEKHFFERFLMFFYDSKRFSVFYYSFWRFQPIFSFCAVSPYLSFSNKQFKTIEAFWEGFSQKNLFFVKRIIFWYFAIKIIPKHFLLILSFFVVFSVFHFFVYFSRFGHFIWNFIELKRFVMTQLMLTFSFEAANVNFQQFWTFFPNFKFLCCFTVFVVSEQVLNDLERFCTTLIKKSNFSERVCFNIWSQKPFPNYFKHSVAVFDVF